MIYAIDNGRVDRFRSVKLVSSKKPREEIEACLLLIDSGDRGDDPRILFSIKEPAEIEGEDVLEVFEYLQSYPISPGYLLYLKEDRLLLTEECWSVPIWALEICYGAEPKEHDWGRIIQLRKKGRSHPDNQIQEDRRGDPEEWSL